jgi:RNA polymerase sigma-70 factor (ECF subfamily)
MLGSRAEAEDLMQDAYLRWHESNRTNIQSAAAFLVTITTRLCVDRLRALKQERAHYVGASLPEPVVDERIPSPEMQREFADDVSVAFLAVLERLGPEERAAFLLHEVFDYDYPEVAQTLDKAEPACRQLIHRARTRLRESHARFRVSTESRDRLLKRFLAAIGSGNRQAVVALLAEEVGYSADGWRQGHCCAEDLARTGPHRTAFGIALPVTSQA